MNILELILENNPDDSFLKADGFDEAVIGWEENSGRLIYSVTKCIEALMAEGMADEDAIDHFYFNVAGAYVGEKTPIFCNDYGLDY
jgi:hypothetical protein